MIDIITHREAETRADDMQAMHRLRYRVFKDRLNWEVSGENGLERDAFDELDDVAYIVAVSDSGRVTGT